VLQICCFVGQTHLDVVDAEILTVACDDILCVNEASERRVRILVIIKDEAVWCVLTVNDGVLAVAIASLELNLLAVMTKTTVADASVYTREKDNLVKLIGCVNTFLNGVVWSGAIVPSPTVSESNRNMDLGEEELERGEPKVGRHSGGTCWLIPFRSEELRTDITTVVGDNESNTMA